MRPQTQRQERSPGDVKIFIDRLQKNNHEAIDWLVFNDADGMLQGGSFSKRELISGELRNHVGIQRL